MEINKQLFEDVLSGKLKGTFVLRNKQIIKSNALKRSSNNNFPYGILIKYDNGTTDYGTYKSNGDFETFNTSYFDIVDFIPETNMKENELTIEIPKGYCIDESKSTFEKIVFKKKDTKPRSWKEYLKQYRDAECYVLGYDFCNAYCRMASIYENGYCTVPSKELAEAFLAMMQLISLREAWVGDWKPNYNMNMASNWTMEYHPNPGKWDIENHCWTNGGGLTFPTKEMATDFMNTFKDLLESAKPLI